MTSSGSRLAGLRNDCGLDPRAGLGYLLKRASTEYRAARTIHVLKLACQLLLLAGWCIVGLGSRELHPHSDSSFGFIKLDAFY